MTRTSLFVRFVLLFLAILPSSPADAVTRDEALLGKAITTPKLDTPFFHTTETSYHWWIVEDDNGHVEDTTDGVIDANDLLRVEHTASCVSSHQGKHQMNFCDAMTTPNGVTLVFTGGLPAYASSLTVMIDRTLHYRCLFSATYPALTNPLQWKILKQELRLKSPDLRRGARIYGWLSVTFAEIDTITHETRTYKIEGYFKPVLQH
ncbi:MAG: hypothetical protein FJ147_01290 [Deltaproteobacteria bacterium]|nr:hypothetical protein [Deltaproteobacteria bacterium]